MHLKMFPIHSLAGHSQFFEVFVIYDPGHLASVPWPGQDKTQGRFRVVSGWGHGRCPASQGLSHTFQKKADTCFRVVFTEASTATRGPEQPRLMFQEEDDSLW